jgi:hypothetical protein
MAFPFQFLLETVLPHILMAKDKKKHSKKDKVSEDILDAAALSIKKFRKVFKEIGKLTFGQKLVGGVALLAVGLTYLAPNDAEAKPADRPWTGPALLNDAEPDAASGNSQAETEKPPVAVRKSRKKPKPTL